MSHGALRAAADQNPNQTHLKVKLASSASFEFLIQTASRAAFIVRTLVNQG